MNLFQTGDFTLASGRKSRWKIECDAATPRDWETWAWMIWSITGPFAAAIGVPYGGMPLARELEKYATPWNKGPILVVDDMWTTGGSMLHYVEQRCPNLEKGIGIKGAVVFARGPLLPWVTAVMPLPEALWDK